MNRSFFISLIAVILLVVFTLININPVNINFFGMRFPDAPLILVILFSVVLGVIISFFINYPQIKKKNKLIAEKESEIKELQGIIKNQPDNKDELASAGQK